jgi:putative ABC transport system ATP-binding protein
LELAQLRREKIGFIFQAYYLIPVLTAYENVELPLVPLAEKVLGILIEVGLKGLENRNKESVNCLGFSEGITIDSGR